MGVYFAVLKPGDKLLTMDLSHGGHLTHVAANFSGKFYEIVHYGVGKEDERITMINLHRWPLSTNHDYGGGQCLFSCY